MFANLVPAGTSHMGQRNVMACRTAVRTAGLPVAAEAVGGEAGRSVWFDVRTGKITVRRVGHAAETL
jgi:chemotaxis protein CheD